jgi:hypothetical protein
MLRTKTFTRRSQVVADPKPEVEIPWSPPRSNGYIKITQRAQPVEPGPIQPPTRARLMAGK